MTCVNFYILPDEQLSSLQQYACRIAEKNWLSGKRVLIQTDSADDSKQLDELLWNLRPESFIPHGIATHEAQDRQQPILLSHQKVTDSNFQYIINLSSRASDICIEPQTTDNSPDSTPPSIPDTPPKELVIDELLNQNEQRKQTGRQHYKIYRDLGYSLKHHTLESTHV
ncbi:MAG TPA: DNA polymerase III subunit chi [Gammaproteobacteria bacterium]|nr:DNA polymerase III subunit chi [Gammaproteobacteria bacterium]